jgi:hypothetical protein
VIAVGIVALLVLLVGFLAVELDPDRARLVRTGPCHHCLEERFVMALVCTRCGCVVKHATAPTPSPKHAAPPSTHGDPK